MCFLSRTFTVNTRYNNNLLTHIQIFTRQGSTTPTPQESKSVCTPIMEEDVSHAAQHQTNGVRWWKQDCPFLGVALNLQWCFHTQIVTVHTISLSFPNKLIEHSIHHDDTISNFEKRWLASPNAIPPKRMELQQQLPLAITDTTGLLSLRAYWCLVLLSRTWNTVE